LRRFSGLLISLIFTWFALCLSVRAVVPPPDGGYPDGNTAEGESALFSLTTGRYNTAVGFLSLRSDSGGSFNTAVGAGTLLSNGGDQNTATGAGALLSNTSGPQNTANGAFALFSNNIGGFNTATGAFALFSNTGTGSFNTAVGDSALFSNAASLNTAVGAHALYNNTTGVGNTALGYGAGSSVTTALNVVAIQHSGADVNNSCFIGNVYGVSTQSGGTAAVVVSEAGQLGTIASSGRYKKNIATMDKASEAILALRPVTFHYKTDTKDTPQFGLIAEEVAKVNPALVLADKEGKPYTVRYEAINAMLLNEFLKERRKVEDQDCRIQQQEKSVAELKQGIQVLTSQLKEQRAQTQKMSDQIQLVDLSHK